MVSRRIIKVLAFVIGSFELFIYVEAKYCAFEIGGSAKYYVCPKTEYCCNFGCCVTPGFQIYHLWYYWLLVIIMFLVCSGGGWWYRYWLQGRYRAAASAIPTTNNASASATSSTSASRQLSHHSRTHSIQQRTMCQGQQASISYNSSRNTVFLHRMWKGPHRGHPASPPYTTTLAPNTSHYSSTNVVLNDINCPYYQLYGPPPSYETVIAQSARIKATTGCHRQSIHQRYGNGVQQTDNNDNDNGVGVSNCHINNLELNENNSALSQLPRENINPSDNVILDALNNHNHNNLINSICLAQCINNDQRPSTSNDNTSQFSDNVKHKLDRSKSLD